MSIFNRNKKTDGSFIELDEVFSRHAKSVNILPRPGFKEALFARLYAVRQAAHMPKVSLASLFLSQKRVFAGAGLTVLVVVVIATMVFQPFLGVNTVFAQDSFTLTAEQADSLGVEANSSYILESKEAVDVAFIKEQLSVNTDTEYGLEQISENKIRIAFTEALPVSSLITFALDTQVTASTGDKVDRPYNWAFQVKSPFRVAGTIPGDRKTGAAIDTGIEINFNYENIKLDDFEKSFAISPSVKGHVEQYRRTFVFVPEEKLQPKTIYTVTVSGDLGLKDSEDTLAQDYVFTFETSYSERSLDLSLGERYLATNPNNSPALIYNLSNGDENESDPIKVEVRQFVSSSSASDFQQYVAALQKSRSFDWSNYVSAESVVDVANMPVVSSFETAGVGSGWVKYVVFPEALPRGYYLADFSVADSHEFALIESSSVTAYAAKAVNETMVWVNSSETKGPIVGAEVNFIGFDEASGISGADGLAIIPVADGLTADQYSYYDLLEVRSGTEAIVLPLQVRSSWFYSSAAQQKDQPILSSSQQNWTYLYTDRPMYKPDDTLKFWGYVENRDSGEKPGEVRVTLTQGGGCSKFALTCYDENDLVFDEVKVELTDRGTFESSLKLENVPSGYYQVMIKIGDEIIARREVSVSEYVKPAYTLSITPDVKAAWAGETIGYSVHGEFFEGTPVAGLSVTVDAGGNQTLVLDSFGNARGSFIPKYYEKDGYPDAYWLRVSPARPEEAGIEASSTVLIFGPKIYMEEDWDSSFFENGNGFFKATVRNVQVVDSYNAEIFAPTVRANQIVTGELYEITYVKKETGTTYDFVRKQTIPQYHYSQVKNKIADVSLVSNEKGEITYSFPATNPEANYSLLLSARDEDGRIEKLGGSIRQKKSYENNDNHLTFENLDITRESQYGFPGYELNGLVNLQVTQNGEPMTVGDNGKFLYFQAQRGIRETALLNSNTYTFPFEANDVPNVSVFGVYFDGTAYEEVNNWGWSTNGFNVSYDNSEKELTVEVVADKEVYSPGEKAELEVLVTDKNGNPVSTEVNLNVVDEAFYALVNEEVDPLGELYKYVDEGILTTQVSAEISADAMTGAEGGGGGDRGRVLFKDTADFAVIETDNFGKAIYNFVLPDNITSWRVTAQALDTENKMAGNIKINLDASLPFFISPVLRESYLVDDEPEVLIRCAGTDIGLGSSVDYIISVDGVEAKKTTALASETVRFTLPKLSEGTHEITIKGASGKLSDTMTRSVNILTSRLVEPIVSSVELNSSSSISGSTDGLTYVTFLDGGRGQYYSELLSLSQTFGDRADEILTRSMATDLINENFGETRPAPSFVSYQGQGISLLSYGDEDFDLSVKTAMLGETPFDEARLEYYFSNALYYESDSDQILNAEEATKAYAALAALGEPVLAEVQRFATESDLNINEKLYLALALHFSGDDEGARTIYRELAKNLTKEFGYAYLSDGDVETQSEQTALLAVLAGALRETDREALHDFVTNQNHNNTLLVLDDVLYLKETLKTLENSEAEIAYVVEGEQREAKLENGQALTLALSSSELAGLKPEVKEGNVIAVSRYDVPLVGEDTEVDSSLGLTRVYSKVDGDVTNVFDEGDLVRVDVVYTVPIKQNSADTTPLEYFEVTDVLPSGLAIVTGTDSSLSNGKVCQSWPIDVVNQRVSFFIDNSGEKASKCGLYTLTYYARVVTPGTYLAESAYIRSVRDPKVNNHSSEVKITISE